MTVETDILRLAASQHGAFSTDQGYLLGTDPPWVRRWVDAGWLARRSPFVLQVAGAPDSIWLDAMAAVLDAGPGAVLAHVSALALWEVPGHRISPAHVIRPRTGIRRTTTIATVHSSRRIPVEHITVLRGIPVTSPTRSCFDSAAVLGPARTARAVDRLWSRRLTSGAELHAMRKVLSARGRTGLSVMDAVLAERGPDYVPPGSGQESRLFALLDRDGQAPLRRQAVMVDPERGFLGISDGVDDLARVVVEVDGDVFHKAITDRAVDTARRDRYRALGYEVVEVDEWDLWHDSDQVVASIREARRRRRTA